MTRYCSKIVLAALLLGLIGCRGAAPLYNVSSSPVVTNRSASVEDVHKAIARAGATLGWQMAQQASGKAFACARRGDCDRENFRLTGRDARHDEAGKRAADGHAMRDHAAVEQQPFDLVIAPAAPERGAMQAADCGGVFRRRIGDDGLGARKQAA